MRFYLLCRGVGRVPGRYFPRRCLVSNTLFGRAVLRPCTGIPAPSMLTGDGIAEACTNLLVPSGYLHSLVGVTRWYVAWFVLT